MEAAIRAINRRIVNPVLKAWRYPDKAMARRPKTVKRIPPRPPKATKEASKTLISIGFKNAGIRSAIVINPASDVNIALFNGCPKPTALEGPTCRLYETPYCHTGYVTSRTRATD